MAKGPSLARVRQFAMLAKELGVSINLQADGSVEISPFAQQQMIVAPRTKKEIEEEELEREREAFERDVERQWQGPNFGRNAEKVMETLVKAGGALVRASSVPYAGPRTVNHLISLGFVALANGVTVFDRAQEIRATERWMSFISQRAKEYGPLPGR